MKKFYDIKLSAEKPKTLELYIYSEIQGDSVDWWTGEKIKSETSAETFKEKIEAAGDINFINIYINSLGGSLYHSLGIYSLLKRHKAYKTVYIDGFACSGASLIAMVGDKVIMPINTLMMIHNAWIVAIGNANELRKAADDLEVMNVSVSNSYLVKSNGKIDSETLKKLLDEETYLSADDCIKYGFADEYGETEADSAQMKSYLEQVGDGNAYYKNVADKIHASIFGEKTKNEPKVKPEPKSNPEPEKQQDIPQNIDNIIDNVVSKVFYI